MRRSTSLGLAAALLLFALGLVVWRLATAPTVLRVAVGPSTSEDARLLNAASAYLAREHESLRLKLVPVDGEAQAAQALDNGKADLALVRTDVEMPTKAQSVAVMHRDAALLMTTISRGIDSIPTLRGKSVGVVRQLPANARLLGALLNYYDLPAESVRVVTLEGPGEVEAAFRSGRIDAVLVVGTVSGRTVNETVAAVTAAGNGAPPVFVGVGEAEAISQRSALYDTFDLVRGAFGGSPPRPSEGIKSVGVNHRLVAATSLEDSTISELTRLLFTMRPIIAREVPLANRIEAPDTSKSSSLPVHPGANAYYENEVETFFDRYSDVLYLGAMVLSVLGSAAAGLVSRAASKRRARTLGLLDRLIAIVGQARSAAVPSALDELDREVDSILEVALAQTGTGRLDHAGVSAFTLGLDQARQAISNRRSAITPRHSVFSHAAE